MTPKEKADKLYHQFYNTLLPNVRERQRIAIEHSLIAVDEIIEQCKDANFGGFELYWQEVKNELLKRQQLNN